MLEMLVILQLHDIVCTEIHILHALASQAAAPINVLRF